MKKIRLYDELAEQAVLGGIFINPDCLPRVLADLKSEYFASEKFRYVFEAILAVKDRGEVIDLVTVSNELSRAGRLEKIGGSDFIGELIDAVSTSAGIVHHVGILKEYHLRRQIASLPAKIMGGLQGEGVSAADILSDLKGAILAIDNTPKASLVMLKEVLPDVVKAIEKASRAEGNLTGVPSGFSGIDRHTGGWQPGEFIIIAGRPGMGKSVFGKCISEAAGVPVAYFSLEMSTEELVKRQIAGRSGVNFEALRTGRVNAKDWEGIIKGANSLSSLDICYVDHGALTIDELIAISENMKLTRNIGLVVIDYLQLIKPRERLEIREREVSEISRKLKAMARNLKIPVVCLAQLNRQCEMRGRNKRPLLSDLRESGSLEQDADIVAFLYREYVYDENASKHAAEFIISKGRNIRTGTVKLHFDGGLRLFRNAA